MALEFALSEGAIGVELGLALAAGLELASGLGLVATLAFGLALAVELATAVASAFAPALGCVSACAGASTPKVREIPRAVGSSAVAIRRPIIIFLCGSVPAGLAWLRRARLGG